MTRRIPSRATPGRNDSVTYLCHSAARRRRGIPRELGTPSPGRGGFRAALRRLGMTVMPETSLQQALGLQFSEQPLAVDELERAHADAARSEDVLEEIVHQHRVVRE